MSSAARSIKQLSSVHQSVADTGDIIGLVSPQAGFIWTILCQSAAYSGEYYRSQAATAADANMSINTFKKYLRELVAKGWVHVPRLGNGRQTTLLRLTPQQRRREMRRAEVFELPQRETIVTSVVSKELTPRVSNFDTPIKEEPESTQKQNSSTTRQSQCSGERRPEAAAAAVAFQASNAKPGETPRPGEGKTPEAQEPRVISLPEDVPPDLTEPEFWSELDQLAGGHAIGYKTRSDLEARRQAAGVLRWHVIDWLRSHSACDRIAAAHNPAGMLVSILREEIAAAGCHTWPKCRYCHDSGECMECYRGRRWRADVAERERALYARYENPSAKKCGAEILFVRQTKTPGLTATSGSDRSTATVDREAERRNFIEFIGEMKNFCSSRQLAAANQKPRVPPAPRLSQAEAVAAVKRQLEALSVTDAAKPEVP